MQADSKALGSPVQDVRSAWEETRRQAKRLFNTEKMAAAGVAAGALAAALALVGLVECAVHQAVESWSISGVGVGMFGFF